MSNSTFIDVHCGFGKTVTAPHWETPDALREALTQRGIGKAFLYSALARSYDPVEGNDLLGAAIATPHEGVDLRGWLVVHPSRLDDSVNQMRKYLLADRFIGAALYADPLTGAPITARNAVETVTAFRRYAKPMLIHTPNVQAMVEAVRIAQDFSGVKFIASGMGGIEWRESIDISAKPLNLFLDISGVLSAEKIDYAASVIGSVRKLLFASGAPDTDPAAVLAMLFESNLGEEDRARVLYGNAERFFGFVNHEDHHDASLAPMG